MECHASDFLGQSFNLNRLRRAQSPRYRCLRRSIAHFERDGLRRKRSTLEAPMTGTDDVKIIEDVIQSYLDAEAAGPAPPRSGSDHRPRQSDHGLCETQMRDPAALLHRSIVAAEDRWALANRAKGFHDRNAGIAGSGRQ